MYVKNLSVIFNAGRPLIAQSQIVSSSVNIPKAALSATELPYLRLPQAKSLSGSSKALTI
jgi:hypothetical protein